MSSFVIFYLIVFNGYAIKVETIINYKTKKKYVAIPDLVRLLSEDEINHMKSDEMADKLVADYIADLKKRLEEVECVE